MALALLDHSLRRLVLAFLYICISNYLICLGEMFVRHISALLILLTDLVRWNLPVLSVYAFLVPIHWIGPSIISLALSEYWNYFSDNLGVLELFL